MPAMHPRPPASLLPSFVFRLESVIAKTWLNEEVRFVRYRGQTDALLE